VANIAAAVAFRQPGARTAVVALLGLSAIVVFHPPPIGPAGLLCFTAAVVLLAREERAPAGWRRGHSALPRDPLHWPYWWSKWSGTCAPAQQVLTTGKATA
jgi:hypothetical protein